MVTKKNPAWGLAEAKARLSEVLARAAREPQIIKRRGRAVGVILDIEQFSETQRRAIAGSAAQRMQSFLHTCAGIREHGGFELSIPKRERRRSPFERR